MYTILRLDVLGTACFQGEEGGYLIFFMGGDEVYDCSKDKGGGNLSLVEVLHV